MRHLPFIQHNQTLIIVVFFLLLFVLLFLTLLVTLATCRRKLRRHLADELQRQRSSHHYYYHARIRQPSTKVIDSNGTGGINDSLYEQLPSLSSDSEQPFLYNEKKSISVNAPALPPHPPTFRHHFCCHPAGRLLHGHMSSPLDYQYAATSATTTTGYSTPTSSQQQPAQCTAVLVWANRLLSPTSNIYGHRECSMHSSPSELQHLQQCLLATPQDAMSMVAEGNAMRYCTNERLFLPAASCHCSNQGQNIDAYIYPHVHR